VVVGIQGEARCENQDATVREKSSRLKKRGKRERKKAMRSRGVLEAGERLIERVDVVLSEGLDRT